MEKLSKIITNYRNTKNENLLAPFKFVHNGETGYDKSFDVNFWKRKDLILALYNNYTPADKPLIKWLLNQEFKSYDAQVDLPVYTIDLCGFMLYKYLEIADVYDLYKVKFGAGSDRRFFVDIELVLGFGAEQTKQFLLANPNDKKLNKEIVKVINWYTSQVEEHIKDRETYVNYFENKKINNIKMEIADRQEEYLIANK